MAFIRVIDEPHAGEALRQAYDVVGAARGRVANIFKIHSLVPETMLAHLQIYKTVMFGRSDLSRMEREVIAVAVSAANDCHY